MFENLKYFHRYSELKRNYDKLADKVRENNLHVCTPEAIVSFILKRSIEWYNYEELPYEGQVDYYNRSKELLDNPVFMNELNHMVADIVQHIARQSKDHHETELLRMTINGVELFEERLKSVKNPHQQKSNFDPYAAI